MKQDAQKRRLQLRRGSTEPAGIPGQTPNMPISPAQAVRIAFPSSSPLKRLTVCAGLIHAHLPLLPLKSPSRTLPVRIIRRGCHLNETYAWGACGLAGRGHAALIRRKRRPQPWGYSQTGHRLPLFRRRFHPWWIRSRRLPVRRRLRASARRGLWAW